MLKQHDEFVAQLGELHRLAHYQTALNAGPLVPHYSLPYGQGTFLPPPVMDQSPLTVPINPPSSYIHPIMQRSTGEQQPLPSWLLAPQYTPPDLPTKFVASKRQAVTAEDPVLQYQQLLHASAKPVTQLERKPVIAARPVRRKPVVATRAVQRKAVVATTAVRSKRLRDEPQLAHGSTILGDMRPPATRQRLGLEAWEMGGDKWGQDSHQGGIVSGISGTEWLDGFAEPGGELTEDMLADFMMQGSPEDSETFTSIMNEFVALA